MELKACPYCGVKPETKGTYSKLAIHKCKAYPSREELVIVPVDVWQSRPIENALREQLAKAVQERDALQRKLDNAQLDIDGLTQANTVWKTNAKWSRSARIELECKLDALQAELNNLKEVNAMKAGEK